MQPSVNARALHIKDLYERMLLARLVDEYLYQLHMREQANTFISCRGYEAAQVGTALCIEVGKDFTLPHYRDLGVIMTIGMSPYEVFCTYLQNSAHEKHDAVKRHWSYQKHNTVTSSMAVATQILHAAGIAFASKLRKVPVVTVVYCGEDVVNEADFLEGISFSAHHKLPIICVCEHGHTGTTHATQSCFEQHALPDALTHHCIEGNDILDVYEAMQHMLESVRAGNGPILLEIVVSPLSFPLCTTDDEAKDPLLMCKQRLQAQGEWDAAWATQLQQRLSAEVEQALHNAVRDIHDASDNRA